MKTEEIISKAIYADNPLLYTVVYRDFDREEQISLVEFLEREIPHHRIIKIIRCGKVVYSISRERYDKMFRGRGLKKRR